MKSPIASEVPMATHFNDLAKGRPVIGASQARREWCK